MNCPYCEKEMEKGTVSFTALTLTQMVLSYASDEESKKGFFSRKSKDKIILSGEKTEAYCCSCCKKVIPVFDI